MALCFAFDSVHGVSSSQSRLHLAFLPRQNSRLALGFNRFLVSRERPEWRLEEVGASPIDDVATASLPACPILPPQPAMVLKSTM
jgi:hypothetical protein